MVFWILFAPRMGSAQLALNNNVISGIKSAEYSLSTGYVLPHREEMKALVTGHSTVVGLTWGHKVSGGWTDSRRASLPVWQGFEMSYIQLGSEGMGSIWSGLWLNRFSFRPSIFSEMGVGLGYATSPYDAVEAPFSFALGTHINAGLRLALGLQTAPNHRGQWIGKIGMTHFSNGAMKMPNLGVNNIHLVVAKKFTSPSLEVKTLPHLEVFAPQHFRFLMDWSARFGIRDLGLPGGVLHPTSTLHALAHFKFSPKSNWRLATAQEICINQSLRVTGAEPHRLQWSALVGVRGNFGNTHLTLLQGHVLKNHDQQLGKRHLLVTLSQDVSPRFGVEIGLRSFRLRADHAFLGVNWRFRRS